MPLPHHGFDEFCEIVAASLDVPPDRLEGRDRVVSGLALDEISLATLVLEIQAANPYFRLPDQMDVHDITLDDLYHHYSVMGETHMERSEGEQ